MKTGKRLLALVLCAVLCVGVLPVAVMAVSNNELQARLDSLEGFPQVRSTANEGLCTTCATAIMLKRKQVVDGLDTSASLFDFYDVRMSLGLSRQAAEQLAGAPADWDRPGGFSNLHSGDGSITYYTAGISLNSIGSTVAARKQYIISLLDSHPEGIVIYCKTSSSFHGILLAHYNSNNDTFYAYDSVEVRDADKRNRPQDKYAIPLNQTYLYRACGSSIDNIFMNMHDDGSAGCVWYVKGGNTPPSSDHAPTPLSISGQSVPSGTLELGKGFSLTGIITSSNNITYVCAYIRDASDGAVKLKYDAQPNKTSYNIKTEGLDKALTFGSLPAGNYEYTLYAEDGAGDNQTLIRSSFQIIASSLPATYTLDVNGWLDGTDWGDLSNYGTFDITVGGETFTDQTDFCRAYPAGTTYSITNIRSSGAHSYHGVHSGALSGTIGSGNVSVSLNFRTNDNIGDAFYAFIKAGDGQSFLRNQIEDGNAIGAPPTTDTGVVWLFQRIDADNNIYIITSVLNGYSLDVDCYGTAPGTNVHTYPFGNNPAQYWVVHEEYGRCLIGSLCTPCVLDLGGAVNGATANTYMNEELGNDWQWVTIEPTSVLDVNGWLDGTESGDIAGYATFDVWIDGVQVADDVADYCQTCSVSSYYAITDIRPSEGHVFMGVHSGSLEGSVGGSFTSVMLDLRTTFILDVNGRLDGQYFGNGAGYCSFDVYIDGIQVCNDYSDFYEPIPYGSSYVITDIRPTEGLRFLGTAADGWGLTGTVADTVGIILEFETIPQNSFLDVNGWLDGTESGATEGYATFDVWVNGSWVADDVTDFCQSFPVGSAYAITDIRPSESHVFMGVHSGSIEGTVGAEYTSVMLDLRTVYVLDVNDIVDGVYSAGTEWMYTFDVYLDGSLVADNCYNYYNTAVPYGTAYEISDIKPVEGYQFLGADSGARPLSGVVTNHTGVNLVFKTMAYLDVNGWLDGVECGALTSYGTFDIYIDGVLAADDVSDFNRPYPVGTPYVITDIRPSDGHVFMGVHSGSLEGTVGASYNSIMLDLRTTYAFDVNGRIDGQMVFASDGQYTFDVLINGDLLCNDYPDCYLEALPFGASYEITDIRPAEGLRFLGAAADGWGLTGTVTGTVGIILEFETVPKTYRVAYDANGGSGAPEAQIKTQNAALILSGTVPIRDGFTFLGWAESVSATAAEYLPGSSYTKDRDTTLFAVWKENVPAPDPSAPQIVIEDLRVTQGETFTVPVVLKNNPGIAGFNLQLAYDTAMLELIDKTAGDFSGLQFSSLDAMPFRFNWDGGTEENTGTVAAVLTFRAKADAEGTTALELSFGNQELPYDALLTDIPFTAVGGEVEIRSFLPGDANGDGTVTMKDSTTVRQHLAGWTVTLAEAAADANGDGVITMKDSSIIRQYLAGWPVTLGGVASGAKGRTVMRSPMRSVPQIVIEDLTAAPGDTISVPILLKNNPGIAGFDLAVSYDTTVLTLTGVTEGDFSGLQTGRLDAVPFQFNWDGGTEENTGAVAAVLTFRVNAGASGCTGITVSVNHGTLPYDSALTDIAFEFRSAEVTIRSGGTSIRSVSFRGGVASVELEGAAENACIFCAAYTAEGRMLALLSSPVGGSLSQTFTYEQVGIAYVKVFLLDSDALPLCESRIASAGA